MAYQKVKVSEHEEQCNFVKWCDLNKIPVFSNPNGVYFPVPPFFPIKYKASLKTIVSKILSKMKKEGAFRKGLPDLTIPIKTEKYGSLYIEMKVKGKYATAEQKQFMKMLENNGNKCVVCYGCSEAIEETQKYLKGE